MRPLPIPAVFPSPVLDRFFHAKWQPAWYPSPKQQVFEENTAGLIHFAKESKAYRSIRVDSKVYVVHVLEWPFCQWCWSFVDVSLLWPFHGAVWNTTLAIQIVDLLVVIFWSLKNAGLDKHFLWASHQFTIDKCSVFFSLLPLGTIMSYHWHPNWAKKKQMIMVYYNPKKAGFYNPLYNLTRLSFIAQFRILHGSGWIISIMLCRHSAFQKPSLSYPPESTGLNLVTQQNRKTKKHGGICHLNIFCRNYITSN